MVNTLFKWPSKFCRETNKLQKGSEALQNSFEKSQAEAKVYDLRHFTSNFTSLHSWVKVDRLKCYEGRVLKYK